MLRFATVGSLHRHVAASRCRVTPPRHASTLRLHVTPPRHAAVSRRRGKAPRNGESRKMPSAPESRNFFRMMETTLREAHVAEKLWVNLNSNRFRQPMRRRRAPSGAPWTSQPGAYLYSECGKEGLLISVSLPVRRILRPSRKWNRSLAAALLVISVASFDFVTLKRGYLFNCNLVSLVKHKKKKTFWGMLYLFCVWN